MHPSMCTTAALEKFASIKGSAAMVLADANISFDVISKFVSKAPISMLNGDVGVDFWSEAVGNNFLKPHNIDCCLNSSLPAMRSVEANSLQQIVGQDTKIYHANPSLPFPIINASLHAGGGGG